MLLDDKQEIISGLCFSLTPRTRQCDTLRKRNPRGYSKYVCWIFLSILKTNSGRRCELFADTSIEWAKDEHIYRSIDCIICWFIFLSIVRASHPTQDNVSRQMAIDNINSRLVPRNTLFSFLVWDVPINWEGLSLWQSLQVKASLIIIKQWTSYVYIGVNEHEKETRLRRCLVFSSLSLSLFPPLDFDLRENRRANRERDRRRRRARAHTH